MRGTLSNRTRNRTAILFLAVLAVGLGGGYGLLRGRTAAGAPPAPQVDGEDTNTEAAVPVDIIRPLTGGLARICQQPGSVEPFEAADLYSKVSGFLIEQKVDIGSAVRAGDVLARIAVPEYEKQLKQDEAEVIRAQAHIEQMSAAIRTAKADLGAAASAIALAQAEQKSKASFRTYREKQRNRIRDLVRGDAIQAQLADEQEDQYQAAISADLAALEAVNAARQKEAAALARVKQAEADLRYSEAEVYTAKTRLEKSQVLLDYTIIRSPYSGVVTKRNFCIGDFIRSADAGGDRVPLLAVERTDVMRVVVQVPEMHVPFVDCGDPAIVEVDALPGITYKTRGQEKVEISRLAASEDPGTRMMRTEVHLKNQDGKLRRGMFGRVTLILEPGSSKAFRIPSAALAGKAAGGQGSVRVVRDGQACLIPVQYGADNGAEVEITSGLTGHDHVIVRAAGPLNDGSTVVETAIVVPGH